MISKSSGKTASGKILPIITINAKQAQNWRIIFAARNQYGSVIAQYHDLDQAKLLDVKVGDNNSSNPTHQLREVFPNKELAQRSAKSTLQKLTQSAVTLNITLIGNPDLVAESKITLQGFNSNIPSDWTVIRAEHVIEAGGFTTRVEAEHKISI